jgi:predicted NAD/FAD-binding protein
MAPLPSKRIAVIGSGISGIGAVWALNEFSEHQVHLFEANHYLGGHTHTLEYKPRKNNHEGNLSTNVDTGFIVQFPEAKIVICRF